MSLSAIDARPAAAPPLVGDAARVEYVFPAARDAAALQGPPCTWVLGFAPALVVSQGRMREIEQVVNPFGAMDHIAPPMMPSFGAGSWVDLLVCPPLCWVYVWGECTERTCAAA